MSERVWRSELQLPAQVDTSGIGAYLAAGIVPSGAGSTVTEVVSGAVIATAAYTANINEQGITSTQLNTSATTFELRSNLGFNTATHSLILVVDVFIGREMGQSYTQRYLGVGENGTSIGINSNGGYSSTAKVWGGVNGNSSIQPTSITADFPHSTRATVAVHYDSATRRVDVYIDGAKLLTGVPIPANANSLSNILLASLGTTKDKFYSLNAFMKTGAFTSEEVLEAVSNPYAAYKTQEVVASSNVVNDYTVGPGGSASGFDYPTVHAALTGTRPATERVRLIMSGSTMLGGDFYGREKTGNESFANSWEIIAAPGQEFTGDVTKTDIATIIPEINGLMMYSAYGWIISGMRFLSDASHNWSQNPLSLAKQYNAAKVEGLLKSCWFQSNPTDTRGQGMSISSGNVLISIVDCLATDYWEDGLSGQRTNNSVVINCKRSGGTSGYTAAFQNNNAEFINCVADVRTASKSFPFGYQSRFIGSNNVSNNVGAARYQDSYGSVDFSSAYVDYAGGDYRFTQTFADAHLIGKGVNGSDIASWLYAKTVSVVLGVPINLSITSLLATSVRLNWEQG